MRITIELDSENYKEAELIKIFSQHLSGAKTEPVHIPEKQQAPPAPIEIDEQELNKMFPKPEPAKSTQSIAKQDVLEKLAKKHDQNKEMGQVANQIENSIGTKPTKMTPKERATAAANAKWAKFRAQKAGLPIPPKPEKKKNKPSDFSRASEQDLNSFEHREGSPFNQELDINAAFGVEPSEVPDGRQIIEGNYDSENVDYDLENDPDVREARERAAEFERQ